MNKTIIAIFSIFVILLLGIPVIIMAGSRIIEQTGKIISPLPENYIQPVITPTSASVKQILIPKEEIKNYLSDKNFKYGLVIKNLDTGETFTENSDDIFPAASLYKLWVMAGVYNDIKNGNLDPEQKLSQSVSVLNRKFNIDPDLAELKEGTVSYSVSDALKQMITISHNYAAMLLTEKITLTKLNNYMKELGLKKSKTGEPPKTTAYETAWILEQIYLHKLIDPDLSDEMLNLLKKQTINRKIPKYLPEGTIIAHKTGELGSVSHDCGIIYIPGSPILMCMLTDSTNLTVSEEAISRISKIIYEKYR